VMGRFWKMGYQIEAHVISDYNAFLLFLTGLI
jgi:hypothetical protein